MSGEVYAFPVHKPQQLTQAIKEFGYEFTLADQKEPVADYFRHTLEDLVGDCLQVRMPDLKHCMLPFQASGYLVENGEDLFVNSLPRNIVHLAMVETLRQGGLDDGQMLTISDLLQPSRQRARVILSNIVNQLQFIRSINQEVAEEDARIALASKEYNLACQQSEALEVEIKRLEAQQAEQQTAASAIQAQAEALLQEVAEKKEMHRESGLRRAKDKSVLAELEHTITTERLRTTELKTACETLQKSLVPNVHELPAAIAALSERIETDKQTIQSYLTQQANVRATITMLEKEELQVVAATNMVSELRRDIQRKKDVARELTATESKISEKQSILKSLHHTEMKLKKQFALEQEKFARMTEQQKMQREAATQSLQGLRTKLAAVKSDTAAKNSRVVELAGSCARIEREMADMKAAHAKQVAAAQAHMMGLLAAVRQQHEAVRKAQQLA